jgi:hypothetical protein
MNRIAISAALVLAALGGAAWSANENPREAPPGTWVHIGVVSADYGADHDTIAIKGHDNFRRLRFKVKDAPLELKRMVVTYESGEPDNIEVRENIAKGGESREIDLKGSGTRSIRRVDFWYSTRGQGQGKADVSLWGMR